MSKEPKMAPVSSKAMAASTHLQMSSLFFAYITKPRFKEERKRSQKNKQKS